MISLRSLDEHTLSPVRCAFLYTQHTTLDPMVRSSSIFEHSVDCPEGEELLYSHEGGALASCLPTNFLISVTVGIPRSLWRPDLRTHNESLTMLRTTMFWNVCVYYMLLPLAKPRSRISGSESKWMFYCLLITNGFYKGDVNVVYISSKVQLPGYSHVFHLRLTYSVIHRYLEFISQGKGVHYSLVGLILLVFWVKLTWID